MQACFQTGRERSLRRTGAFTLIELLIVVAIIAILAAIAVPNFLEAQTRAKISRVQSDLRTISLGIHSYLVDNNKTPYLYEAYGATGETNPWMYNAYIYHHFAGGVAHNAVLLTTPVSYLDTITYPDPFDMFGEAHDQLDQAGYVCLSLQGALADGKFATNWMSSSLVQQEGDTYSVLSARNFKVNGQTRSVTFLLASPGPDKKWATIGTETSSPSHLIRKASWAQAWVDGEVALYDPTNGTNSAGELVRFE